MSAGAQETPTPNSVAEQSHTTSEAIQAAPSTSTNELFASEQVPPSSPMNQRITWLGKLRLFSYLMGKPTTAVILVLTVIMAYWTYASLRESKKANRIAKWSAIQNFRDECRVEHDADEMLSDTCSNVLSQALHPPPTPRTLKTIAHTYFKETGGTSCAWQATFALGLIFVFSLRSIWDHWQQERKYDHHVDLGQSPRNPISQEQSMTTAVLLWYADVAATTSVRRRKSSGCSTYLHPADNSESWSVAKYPVLYSNGSPFMPPAWQRAQHILDLQRKQTLAETSSLCSGEGCSVCLGKAPNQHKVTYGLAWMMSIEKNTLSPKLVSIGVKYLERWMLKKREERMLEA